MKCLTSFPGQEREGEKKINRVYSIVTLKGKLSLVSNDTIGHCCELLHCDPCQEKITLRTKRMPTEATSESFRNMIRGEGLSPEFCARDKILGDLGKETL